MNLKKHYESPEIKKIGTVEEMTMGPHDGGNPDASPGGYTMSVGPD